MPGGREWPFVLRDAGALDAGADPDGRLVVAGVSAGVVRGLSVDASGRAAVASASGAQVDGHSATLGTTTDAEASSGNGSLVALLKRLRTLLNGGLPAALVGGRLSVDVGAGTVTANVQGVSATSSLSGTSPAAASTVAGASDLDVAAFGHVYILATLQGAAGGALDVYLQSSPDGGTTWVDVVHFPQVAAGAAAVSYAVSLSRSAGSSAPRVVGTATPALAANVVEPGAFGDRLRVMFVAGAGTTAGASQVVLVAKGQS